MGLKTLIASSSILNTRFLKRNPKTKPAGLESLVKKLKKGTISSDKLKKMDRETVRQALLKLLDEGILNNYTLNFLRWEELVTHPKVSRETKIQIFKDRAEKTPSLWREETFKIITESPHVPKEISEKVIEERARKMVVLSEEEFDSFLNSNIPEKFIILAATIRGQFFPTQVLSHPKTPPQAVAEIINNYVFQLARSEKKPSELILKVIELINYRPKSEWQKILDNIDPQIKNLLESVWTKNP